MKEYGRYVLMGVGIFLFICVVAIFFAWCTYHKDKNERNQLDPYKKNALIINNAPIRLYA